MATVDDWASVLAIAAGPWKRREMHELAANVLENVQLDAVEAALQTVRRELNAEVCRCLVAEEDPNPLLRVLQRVGAIPSEEIMTSPTEPPVTLQPAPRTTAEV